jgi:hypothetical protein
MAEVVFHIPIRHGFHGQSWLLETIYDLDFLPLEGDVFHPLKNDPESGLSMAVRRRWWTETGSVQIETHTHIINMPDTHFGDPYSRIYRGWNFERDGDLVAMLLANGWWEYGKKQKNTTDSEMGIKTALIMVEEHLTYGIATVEQVVKSLQKIRDERKDDDEQQ